MRALLVLQAVASLNLMGLIWCIQLVHYPMFARLERANFGSSLVWHGRAITPLVGPWMLLELVCALYLWAFPPGPSLCYSAGAWLVGGIWVSTGLLQVPLHGRLCRGFDEQAWRSLVRSNWIRTVLWSLRGGLALAMLL